MIKTPKHGDIMWLDVEPHKGHEVDGHDKDHPCRPVLVISDFNYNKSGLIVGMPVTSHNRINGQFKDLMLPIHADNQQVHGYFAPFEPICLDYYVRQDPQHKHPEIMDHDSSHYDWHNIKLCLHDILKGSI